jgi:hypothetical protein
MGNHGPGVSCCGILTSLFGITEMNERIRELADEARIKFSAHWAHQGVDTAVITRLDLKEFAELIVRECARIVNENDCEGSIVGDGMLFEHFGVEE